MPIETDAELAVIAIPERELPRSGSWKVDPTRARMDVPGAFPLSSAIDASAALPERGASLTGVTLTRTVAVLLAPFSPLSRYAVMDLALGDGSSVV